MSPTIRGAIKHAVFLGFVSVALLSAAALGGDGCSPAGAAAPVSAACAQGSACPSGVNAGAG
jgi:hypothetical protein